MQLDSEDVGHEPPPIFDPLPGRRVFRGERAPQRLVGDRDAVLDVRREVLRSGRGDDVDLQGHPGAELDRGAGPDWRVDPLVEVKLVTGIERDAEERIAEPPVDDLVESAARDSDPERPIPLADRLEVRRYEPFHVVLDPEG